MSDNWDYSHKFEKALTRLDISNLSEKSRKSFLEMAFKLKLTFQELRILSQIMIDCQKCQIDHSNLLNKYLESPENENRTDKALKKLFMQEINEFWTQHKNTLKSYSDFCPSHLDKIKNINFTFSHKDLDKTILGKCPVASEKTLCCNLQTLDVINNCGFECSYCSIQSFFPNNTIMIEDNILSKLERLTINPNKIYHIGTGQSSDSMLWGNKNGVLKQLCVFAKNNPNVILEFKTKSKNISFFLKHEIPRNIICTWSINTDTIINNEEHHTASAQERIKSARALADKNILVGFHFHPIIKYEGYKEDYSQLINNITSTFSSNEIAMISLGTLTFTKPVLKQIREKKIFSKILQMPMENAAGKFSYPFEDKVEMFKFIYDRFVNFHKNVFFYLCMEDESLWSRTLGKTYLNNEEFEKDMKSHYIDKIYCNQTK